MTISTTQVYSPSSDHSDRFGAASRAFVSPLLGLMMFAVGATAAIPVMVVGKIGLGEIIGAIVLLFLFLTGAARRLERLYPFMALAAVWLICVIISSEANDTAAMDTARAVANAGFAWLNLLVFYVAFQHSLRVAIPFAAGNCISQLSQRFTDPDLVRSFTDYYQTVLLPAVVGASLLCIVLFLYKSRGLTLTALAGLAATAILCDSRSVFLIVCFTCVCYALSSQGLKEIAGIIYRRLRWQHLALLAAAAFGAYLLLVECSERGWLGSFRQRQVARMENRYNPFEYLLKNGRGAIASSLVAIERKPLIGHGPNADGRSVVLEARRRYGVKFSRSELSKFGWTIPTHSVVLNSWVEAGIGGILVWVFVIYYLVRYGLLSSAPPERIRAWFLFSVASCLWALGFSPLSYSLRQILPAVLAIAAVARADNPLTNDADLPPRSPDLQSPEAAGYLS